MKVLHVISGADNGGAKVHLLSLALNNNYFENEIFCINKGPLYEEAKLKGIKTHLTEGKLVKNIRDLSNLLNNERYDIVNFHGAKPNLIYYIMKKYKNNINAVTTLHSDYRYDFIHNKFKKLVFTFLNKISLKSFSNFICVSERIRDVMENLNFEGNFFVVNNGIDFNYKEIETRESIRKRLNLLDSFVFCMVARLHPVKNHVSLIEAFYKLSKELDDVKLLLVGDGELREEIEKQIDILGIREKVKMVGNVSNPRDYINASDVNILTSTTETFPLVLLEGATVKKVPVSTNVGDVKNIIFEETGYIIEGFDSESIYRTMLKVYKEKELLNTKAEKFYEIVKQNYTIEKFWKRYYDSYKKIIEGGCCD